MNATYTITETDFINAASLNNRFTAKRATIYLLGFCFVLLIWFLPSMQFLQAIAIGGLSGVVLVEILGRSFINSMLLKKQYREYAAIKLEQEIELVDGGIKFAHTDASMLLRWGNILKWRHNNDYILVFQNRRLYHIISTSISEQGFPVDDLINQLTNNIGRPF